MSSLLVFNRAYRQEMQSVVLLFSILLVNQRLSNLLTGSSTPLPPFPVRISTGAYVFNGWVGGSGASVKYTPAAKYLYWSIFKKSRHLGFGIFIDIWSMIHTRLSHSILDYLCDDCVVEGTLGVAGGRCGSVYSKQGGPGTRELSVSTRVGIPFTISAGAGRSSSQDPFQIISLKSVPANRNLISNIE